MSDIATLSDLKPVDGLELDEPYRAVLRPGELLTDDEGRRRRLPRFFYEIESWEMARRVDVAPHFGLYEFIQTDVREAEPLRGFPRYVPCALPMLAAVLALFRKEVGTYVHIAANGGYRSPGHVLSRGASRHHWGTAANIYRVGDDFLDDAETIGRYAGIIREIAPSVWIRPHGSGVGEADDHLHIDLGYVVAVPPDAPGEPEED
jgi:hypothetical protein